MDVEAVRLVGVMEAWSARIACPTAAKVAVKSSSASSEAPTCSTKTHCRSNTCPGCGATYQKDETWGTRRAYDKYMLLSYM